MLKKILLKSICCERDTPKPQYFLALIAGVILFFSFAPFGVYPLAIFASALLLFVWTKTTARQAFFSGWIFGASFFGLGASWVYISMHVYGFMPIPLAVFATILFVLTLGLFPAVQGYCLNKIFPQNNARKILLGFPTLFVLTDWLRSTWVMSGFPWLGLGYSQIDSPLRGLAPIVGVYGITFASAFTAGAIVYGLITKNNKTRIVLAITIILLWLSSYALSTLSWTKPIDAPIKVSLVQGNIPQEMKWQEDQLLPILQQYYKLTTSNWQNQIIVWPEAAIPALPENIPTVIKQLDTAAKKHHVTLLTGINLQSVGTGYRGIDFYNSIISLGTNHQQYRKRHLVPFGEYTPLPWLFKYMMQYFNIPMSNFTPGARHQEPFVAANIVIAPFICYEIAYPGLVLDYLPQAQLLLTVSDDSWFGRSIAAVQHLEIARMRSAESGRYQMVATNTGVTAFIDDHGRIIKQAPSAQQIVLTGEVQPMTGTTPWVKLGHYFGLGISSGSDLNN